MNKTKRMPRSFYDAARKIRARFGEKPYSRDAILPSIVDLIREYPEEREQHDIARAHAILDNIEKAEDTRASRQGEMFGRDDHVAIGGGLRIKRGRMTREHLLLRERLIDGLHEAHNNSWSDEKRWLREAREALEGRALDATVSDIVSPEVPA